MTSRSAFRAGVAALVAVWGVLPWIAAPPFAAHMVMHMTVVAVAAPLIVMAVAGGPWDPVRRVPGAFSPVVASMVELVLVWAWHAPALHHAARHEWWARVLEQGSFLLAGMFLWLSAFGGGPSLRRERATGGVTGLLLTSMHMTLLGALLVLTHRSLFAHGHGGSVWGLSPIHDQQLGGAIMLIVGGAAYLGGALWLTAEVLARRREGRA